MAMVVKTMEEILKEMTPERMALEAEWLKNHVDEYDPENPPLTKDELSRFRPYKEVEYERKLIKKYRQNAELLTSDEYAKVQEILEKRNQIAKQKSKDDYTPPQRAA